jgi:hypothetical protein
MRNTAEVTGGKPIAVLSQSISGVSAISRLVAFYDIHEGRREVLFFYFVPDTTRDYILVYLFTFYLFLIIIHVHFLITQSKCSRNTNS